LVSYWATDLSLIFGLTVGVKAIQFSISIPISLVTLLKETRRSDIPLFSGKVTSLVMLRYSKQTSILGTVMSDMPIDTSVIEPVETEAVALETPPTPEELKTKYVKYAMKNMVKKGSKSLQHFALSAIGLLSLFVALAYLTR
jgi:Protein of unknown function (DUF3285)